MSARPFQVGDRVRIVGWDTYGPHEGTITEIQPGKMRTDGFLAGVPRSALIVTDCEYTLDSGSTALACAALSEDLTGAGWYGGQIELIDAADDAGRIHDVVEAEVAAYREEAAVTVLAEHYDMFPRDGRMHCAGDCGYTAPLDATLTDIRRHQARLILAIGDR